LFKDKINLALFWPRYSGNVTSFNDLVLGLDKKRFNVIFIYISGYGVEKNLLKEAGYKVFYLSNIQRINTFRFSILFRLVRILKEHNVDIIHCHRHKSMVYGTIAAVLAKTPVVLSHVHGLDRTRNMGRRLLNFFLFKRVNRIIGCARSVREDVLKNNWSVPREKISVLENSVDYERFADVSISKEDAKRILGLPSDAFVFGTIGRLTPTKGQLYLIEAFAKVKQKLPKSMLLLIGDGRLENVLRAEASKTGFGKSIHFFGWRTDIPQILKALDVFVLSSLAEGTTRAILEAMAAGVPCVATEVGGIQEIIIGNNVGLLVPPKDENALAEAMITLANAPEQKLKGIIERAKERIRSNFNHDVVMKKLENTYEMEINHYYESNRRKKRNV
jgi:glycosyltransferase involved in cell wall biosynthesis